MPLAAQCLDDNIRHRLPALPTLGAVAVRVAVAAPRVPILLDKRRASIERVAALRAEEVAGVPLGAASHDDLAFDRGLAGLAARAEHLVEVQRAVEAQGRLAVGFLSFVEFVHGDVFGEDAVLAGCDALQTSGVLRFGLGVERHVFKIGIAFVAVEARRVQALTSGREYATRNGLGTVSAKSLGLAQRGSVMRCRLWQGGRVCVMVHGCLLGGSRKRAVRGSTRR